MVPGGAAGLAAEEGGRNALYVRVDIGSLEVGLPLPTTPLRPQSASHPDSRCGSRAMLTQRMGEHMRRDRHRPYFLRQ